MPGPIRDAAKTRSKILKVASVEFATHSFDGARVERIALKSNINKQMLYHYFGSKEGLFSAVLEEMYRSIRESQKDVSLAAMAPLKALRLLVIQTNDVIVAHPEFIGLLNSENLMKARHIKASAAIRKMYVSLIPTLADTLERGVREGVFRADIDPLELYISIGSLCFHSRSNQHTLKAIFNVDLNSAAARGRRLEHVLDMVCRYCAPVPRTSAAKRERSVRLAEVCN